MNLPAVFVKPHIALADWAINKRVRRDPDEVLVLLIDLARRGAIKPRPGWVRGKERKIDG